jgi:hypothetical protein
MIFIGSDKCTLSSCTQKPEWQIETNSPRLKLVQPGCDDLDFRSFNLLLVPTILDNFPPRR